MVCSNDWWISLQCKWFCIVLKEWIWHSVGANFSHISWKSLCSSMLTFRLVRMESSSFSILSVLAALSTVDPIVSVQVLVLTIETDDSMLPCYHYFICRLYCVICWNITQVTLVCLLITGHGIFATKVFRDGEFVLYVKPLIILLFFWYVFLCLCMSICLPWLHSVAWLT